MYTYIPGGPKKLYKSFICNSCCLAVVMGLLFKSPDALWLWHLRKRLVIVVYFKTTPQRVNLAKVSAFLRGDLAQSFPRSRSAWTMAKVSTNVEAVVERLLSLKWLLANCPSNSVSQAVTIHNSLSTTACTTVDIFAIVYTLHVRVDACARHPEKDCELTHFVSLTKKCKNFHSTGSLRSHFEIQNNGQPFSSMSYSQSIVWVKQKPNNPMSIHYFPEKFIVFPYQC